MIKQKTVCVVINERWGDIIQASGILPELKRQGYHITFSTSQAWGGVIQHDPHIDQLLMSYEPVTSGYDRIVNLQGQLAGRLFAIPPLKLFWKTEEERRVICNKNYSEQLADAAGVPFLPESKFYPSATESASAKMYFGNKGFFNIVWCLAGSTFDKCNPHHTEAIQMVLDNIPEALISLNGDDSCRKLEQRWSNNGRVRKGCGVVPIRMSMSFAREADCVVGPDTGLMQAVAYEPVGKVLMLSHTTIENISKHWLNTDTLTAKSVDCYPCHRVHDSPQHCNVDAATGYALCQQSITAQRIFDSINTFYKKWKGSR